MLNADSVLGGGNRWHSLKTRQCESFRYRPAHPTATCTQSDLFGRSRSSVSRVLFRWGSYIFNARLPSSSLTTMLSGTIKASVTS